MKTTVSFVSLFSTYMFFRYSIALYHSPSLYGAPLTAYMETKTESQTDKKWSTLIPLHHRLTIVITIKAMGNTEKQE